MHVAVQDLKIPAKIVPESEHALNDDEFFEFCQANPDLNLELTAHGEIVIMPPAGPESDYRSLKVGAQLDRWAEQTDNGKAFGSTAGFVLPNGAGRSPDAAWVSNERISRFTKKERKKFMRLVPEFVVEVLSPSDRLLAAKAKMEEWIANGAQLGWLFDADNRTVYVYRPGEPPEVKTGISILEGEGPVQGFVLQLESIWEGL